MKSPVVILTAPAWEAVYNAQNGVSGAFLRVGVAGGGCVGYQYVLESLARSEGQPWPLPRDICWTQYDPQMTPELADLGGCGIGIAVDVISAQYLKGTTIDYVKTGLIEGFRFDNPNAKTRCGCGKSFGT